MDLTVNRDKTRITKLTEGFDFIGFEFVKSALTHERQAVHQHTSEQDFSNARSDGRSRASRSGGHPIQPAEFVKQVNQTVRGWVGYYRHTNASDAFRNLQRFINIRFRRYLNYRSKGRGFGWKKYPNATLYARGMIYIGSGVIEYDREPAHGV